MNARPFSVDAVADRVPRAEGRGDDAVADRVPALSERGYKRAYAGAGQKTPPVIGAGTPVVPGNEIGRPFRERRAR